MNNDIKEINKFKDILNYYKAKQIEPTYCEELITTGELQALLDYITNLQEENEELRKNQRFHKKFGNDYIFCVEGDKETYKDMVLMYQERIDKAIEYINAGKTFNSVNVGQVVNKIQNDLLNILEGENNE